MGSLAALLFPALALPLLLALSSAAHLPALGAPRTWPSELWIVASAGTLATAAGLLDWRLHRRGQRRVSPAERRAELLALLAGALLFVLLAAASTREPRRALAAPIVAVALLTAALIAFDESRFHRRCSWYETLLHRLLVGGQALAFLAWFHWCFAREGAVA